MTARTTPLFFLKLELKGDGDPKAALVQYMFIETMLGDKYLRALFDDGLVASCEITLGDGKSLTKMLTPEWHRLLRHVVAKSSVILEQLLPES